MTDITTDQDQTVSTTEAGERLTVEKGVTIDPPASDYGLVGRYADNVIVSFGHVYGGRGGVALFGDGDRFINKVGGVIEAKYSAILVGDGDSISATNRGELHGEWGYEGFNTTNPEFVNEGVIRANNEGISFHGDDQGDIHVSNSGSIIAQIGIDLTGHGTSHLYLDNSGLISGTSGAIGGEFDTVTINNSGQIDGVVYLGVAYHASSVINTGVINGNVLFASRDDLFDGSAGRQNGLVAGGSGNDTLLGGAFADTLSGGRGADQLDGGQGGDDVFGYTAVRASNRASHDLITSWSAGDRIDLSGFDADKQTKGHQDTTFAGEIAPGGDVPAGAAAYYHQGGDTYVVVDHNSGDSHLVIQIAGEVTLTADNFIF